MKMATQVIIALVFSLAATCPGWAGPKANGQGDFEQNAGSAWQALVQVQCVQAPNSKAKSVHVFKKGSKLIPKTLPGKERTSKSLANAHDSQGHYWMYVEIPGGKAGYVRANSKYIAPIPGTEPCD